jgi:hypothetical protein
MHVLCMDNELLEKVKGLCASNDSYLSRSQTIAAVRRVREIDVAGYDTRQQKDG